MSYYIIIRGPLGSGKSTISKKLARVLKAKHFELDKILEKHGLDKTPLDAPCIPAENFIKANEIIHPPFLYWSPRILAILFILFLALFSLDIFDGNYRFWGTIIGLFMHNIPVFILIIVLLISWRHEIVGGIVFILAGFLLFHSLPLAIPSLLIGLLFLLNWFKRKRS